MLAHRLGRSGIECVNVDLRTRSDIEATHRAGILEAGAARDLVGGSVWLYPQTDVFIDPAHAHSEHGFALMSQRTDQVQRMYFQCDPDEDTALWGDDRIWQTLQTRVAGDDGFTLIEGPVIEKTVLRFRSFVQQPMRWDRWCWQTTPHTRFRPPGPAA